MSIQLTQHAGETNYSTGALQSQLQWPTENGLNDSIIGGPTSQSVRSGLFLLYVFILSGCFLFLWEAGRHRGERPSNHSRTEAHVNSQSLAECTQPVTGSSQVGSGIEGGHADTISTPNQEAICNGQPLAKGKLVFSRVSSDHHTSGQAHTRE